MAAEPSKRPLEGAEGGGDEKRTRNESEDWQAFADKLKQKSGNSEDLGAAPAVGVGASSGDIDDDFDALFAADLEENAKAPPEPPDEIARRSFAERAMNSRQLSEADLAPLLEVLTKDAPKWERLRRWRSCSLLLVVVVRSSRVCRGAFISTGLPVLGGVMQEAVLALETGDAAARQEAGMWALACLMCLRALSLGRAALWEHRHSLGKPFDRLHRWCGREKTALAAELRAPTNALCQHWKRQPRPAGQAATPEEKALREKVVEMVAQGLLGIAGGNSPASPVPISVMSPGALPTRLVSVEVEAALFGRFGSATQEYKQHARMLRSNLAHPENTKLRERVLTGELAAEELAKMDSWHLAPVSLQEARRKAELTAMKESVVEDLLPRMRSRDDEFGQGSMLAYTAPPVFVRSPQRGKSTDSLGSDKSEEPEKKEFVLPPLEPPPTPFRDMSMSSMMAPPSIEVHQGSPDLMATPAPEDEDEEQDALVQYLSKPVRL